MSPRKALLTDQLQDRQNTIQFELRIGGTETKRLVIYKDTMESCGPEAINQSVTTMLLVGPDQRNPFVIQQYFGAYALPLDLDDQVLGRNDGRFVVAKGWNGDAFSTGDNR